MKREDLERLKAEIERNYKADIAAVDQLLTKFNQTRQDLDRKLIESVEASRPRKRPSEIVEAILIRSGGEKFDVSSILWKFREQTGKPDTRARARIVSQVINKLRQRNPPEIEAVEQGRGSRSGVYRYTGSKHL
jgi:hypothetical protein